VYTDADWAGDKGNRKSTSGYFSLVGDNLVTWKSKKQKVVSLSSAEAEFRGISRGLAEVLWIRKLLTEVGFPPKEDTQKICHILTNLKNIIMDQSAGLRMFESDTIKLNRMDGMNFTRWKEKIKFLLTAFKVYYVLEGPPIGVLSEEEQRKRDQDETLCRGYILSTLTDRLYDLYTPMTSAREI
nr:putative reverse transcriptase, RNA-dependent DNA polymerase [Tanacetum cinerariifolium]